MCDLGAIQSDSCYSTGSLAGAMTPPRKGVTLLLQISPLSVFLTLAVNQIKRKYGVGKKQV